MFEVPFIYHNVLARHQAGPAAVDREPYLALCAGRGAAPGILPRIARELLLDAERTDVKRVRPHSIGYTTTTHLLRAGVDIKTTNVGFGTCRWRPQMFMPRSSSS